ncbi:hypothetical protein HDU91_005904 [Kappamyces sp. JEL0680]|nr:hypothetical protein HDU91_005904 [Kappamyces sp. JEL0680]
MFEFAASSRTLTLGNIRDYAFEPQEAQAEGDEKFSERMAVLRQEYESKGPRTTVLGVLLVHDHEIPHVLVLKLPNNTCKLPGDALAVGEDERLGLQRHISKKLSLAKPAPAPLATESKEAAPADAVDAGLFEIGELLGTLYRPNFEPHLYPYLPAHIKRAKEIKKIYHVHLPEESKVQC